jgi:hypothetical protein
MQPTPGPRRNDDRNAWLPFVIIAALIVLLFLSLIIVFRDDDEADRAVGSLPASFDSLTIPTSTTPPTTPPTTELALVIPTTAETDGTRPSRTDAPGRDATTTTQVDGPEEALTQRAQQLGATVTTDVVPIGSDLYAMVVSGGRGQLLRWSPQRQWDVVDRINPPSAIRTVETADVTGDGTQDFIITLSGVGQPAGVYSRATFQFGMLPFNTLTGQEDFVDGLVYQFGRLQSPFQDTSGTRLLIWTWTGRMFETR